MLRFLLIVAILVPGLALADNQPGGPLGNIVSGAASATGTGATTLITFGTSWPATLRIYVKSVQCARTDGGTSAIYVTLNDSQSTIVVVPNNGGGGGNNMVFDTPLVVSANTSLTFTASSGVSTLYCNAQGYTAN